MNVLFEFFILQELKNNKEMADNENLFSDDDELVKTFIHI